MHHIPFATFAGIAGAVAVLIIGAAVSGPVRRHLMRLTESLVIGAAVAFGITAWVDGQHHAALAAAAAHPAAHGHKVPVGDSVSAAFAVITLIVAVIAFVLLSVAARYHQAAAHVRHYQARTQLAAGVPHRRGRARGRVRAW